VEDILSWQHATAYQSRRLITRGSTDRLVNIAVLSYWSLATICAFLGFTHYYILPYFSTYKDLRRVPGPFLAGFSNIWLAFGARRGKKFAWVHWAHEKYAPVVRVGYNHVSIAEPEGLQAVYAHGNGFLKE
jgi:benzoate 4-monooxygenase